MRGLISIVFFASIYAAMPSRAQDEAGSPAVFLDSLDVDVINVEVFVTDKAGRPVMDLEAADFELREDGQPVEITNFFRATRIDRRGEAPAPVPGTLGAPERFEPVPEDQRLHLAVYVDHFNLRPEHRKRVFADLEGFLEDRLERGDRVMLVGYDRKLQVAVPFTRDCQAVLAGLESMEAVAPHRPIADAELRRAMRNMTLAWADEDLRGAYQFLRSYVASAESDLRHSARALEQTVRALAGAPGRKAILYVSSGLPQRPGEVLYRHLLDLFGSEPLQEDYMIHEVVDPSIEALMQDQSHLFNRITREANSHQVTFYTLDARGPSAGSTLSAEFGLLSPSDAGRTVLDQIRSDNLQEPLLDMAVATGGRAVLNTNNFDGTLGRVAEDFDAFYSLGYRPPSGRDGKYHKIVVRVNRRGVNVRHRHGYESKPEAERVADRTLSSLLLGLPKNPLGVVVEFAKPEKRKGQLELPILIKVPIDQVTLVARDGSSQGRLQFFLVVQDDGGISDLHRKSYPIQIPADQLEAARGREIGYATKLKIRQGTPTIAVGVWDELSGLESFVHKRVLVEAKKTRSGRKGGI